MKSDQDIEGKKKGEKEREKKTERRKEEKETKKKKGELGRKRIVGKVVSGRSEELVFKCFSTRCS